MTAMTTADDLWDEALALLLHWQEEPEDEARREAILRFCARGSGHQAAWAEAARIHRLSGQASRLRRRRGTRRRVLAGGATGALALAAATIGGPELWRRWSNDATTGTAEMRREQLPDGSWMTLGARSAVRLAFSAGLRGVTVEDGAAFIEVAELAGPPFLGRAGGLEAAGAGGAFELRREGAHDLIAVAEGRFEGHAAWRPTERFSLEPGDWLASEAPAGPVGRGRRPPTQVAPWRRRQLIADRQDVREIVAEIQRWHAGRILILQDRLAEGQVSGLYDLGDTDGALRALVAPFGGRVRHISPWLTVLSAG